MRLFLAALTIGAAGIGYVYVQQTPLPAAESRVPVRRPLFDWQSANDPVKAAGTGFASAEPPLVVRDTINSTRSEITSVLDEFVRGSGQTVAEPQTDIVSRNAGHQTQADASRADVASQVAAVSESVPDPELTPFATSDAPANVDGADISTADAAPSTNPGKSSQDVVSQDVASKDNVVSKGNPVAETPAPVADTPVTAKPAVNEATLVTQGTNSPTEQVKVALPVKQPTTGTGRTKPELLPGKMLEKGVLIDPEWTVIGKTAKGLPLHSRRYGRQGTRTLIIAGLDGLDLMGTRWNDALSEALLQRTSLLQTNEVLVIRAGNPEGLTRKQSTNSRSVLINRNFPSRRYQFLSDNSTGTGPASEAETKAILDVLYSFRPRRIIHLASTGNPSSVVYNRAAKGLAEELGSKFKLDLQPLDGEQAPGSLEDFADGTLDAGVLSLKLNTGSEWQLAWRKHLPVLMTAIGGSDKLVSVSDELAQSSPDQIGTLIPILEDPEPTPKRRRGYEELPSPGR